MLHRLGFLVAMVALALPAWSAERPGTSSGYVRNAGGVPQMGAVVELLGDAAQTLTVFTDQNGFYSATGLLPGLYNLKVTAASFLPTWKDRIGLHPGARVLVNVTLNTLFEAIKFPQPRGTTEEDDWKWVLRSSANRPILRLTDDPALKAGGDSGQGFHDLKGS